MSAVTKALDDLKLAVRSNSITIKQIVFWLKEYNDLYEKQTINYSCSIHEPKLPCFCEKRRVDCLFIDLFREFKKLENLIIREEEFGNLVQEYNLLEQNELDLSSWNKRLNQHKENLKVNSKGEFIRLNNGKENNKYRNIILNIAQSEFVNHNELWWIKTVGNNV